MRAPILSMNLKHYLGTLITALWYWYGLTAITRYAYQTRIIGSIQ